MIALPMFFACIPLLLLVLTARTIRPKGRGDKIYCTAKFAARGSGGEGESFTLCHRIGQIVGSIYALLFLDRINERRNRIANSS